MQKVLFNSQLVLFTKTPDLGATLDHRLVKFIEKNDSIGEKFASAVGLNTPPEIPRIVINSLGMQYQYQLAADRISIVYDPQDARLQEGEYSNLLKIPNNKILGLFEELGKHKQFVSGFGYVIRTVFDDLENANEFFKKIMVPQNNLFSDYNEKTNFSLTFGKVKDSSYVVQKREFNFNKEIKISTILKNSTSEKRVLSLDFDQNLRDSIIRSKEELLLIKTFIEENNLNFLQNIESIYGSGQ